MAASFGKVSAPQLGQFGADVGRNLGVRTRAHTLHVNVDRSLVVMFRLRAFYEKVYVLRIPVIAPSSPRSISHAFGFDGRPGNVIMSPARATICLAPARIRSSLIGIVCPDGAPLSFGSEERDK